MLIFINMFFFFQAEDGIRDADVTGVQTCALPISCHSVGWHRRSSCAPGRSPASTSSSAVANVATTWAGQAIVVRHTCRLKSRWAVWYQVRCARIAGGELGSSILVAFPIGQAGVACRSPRGKWRGPRDRKGRRRRPGRDGSTGPSGSEGGTDRPCRHRGGTTLEGAGGGPTTQVTVSGALPRTSGPARPARHAGRRLTGRCHGAHLLPPTCQ